MATYLGVDGGGTKTAFVLITGRGEILGTVEGPSSYHVEHGFAAVRQVFVDGVRRLAALTGVGPESIDFSFFGIPGYGESSEAVARLDRIPEQALGHDRYRSDNDMIAGWAGSLAVADGINVVAGTGSMTYGERGGRGARVGGWGELFGDEGSGYWLGLQALKAFSRMSDGRVPRTGLHGAVRRELGVTEDLDAVHVVLTDWGSSRGRIASLAPVAVRAAEHGDPVAAGLVRAAADHLVDLVDATRRQLGFVEGAPVPVSYSGGMFRAPLLLDGFTARLTERSHDFALAAPRFSPVIGAALYAAHLSGGRLDQQALRRLETASRSA